jgi:hypothetical protein
MGTLHSLLNTAAILVLIFGTDKTNGASYQTAMIAAGLLGISALISLVGRLRGRSTS